jgi:hypothetical protein
LIERRTAVEVLFWGALLGLPAGVVGGILGVLLLALVMPRKKCPDCGAGLPKLRNTWNSRTIIRTCPECGCGVDIKGRKVEE